MTIREAEKAIDEVYKQSLAEEREAYSLPTAEMERRFNDIREKEKLLIDAIREEVDDGNQHPNNRRQ